MLTDVSLMFCSWFYTFHEPCAVCETHGCIKRIYRLVGEANPLSFTIELALLLWQQDVNKGGIADPAKAIQLLLKTVPSPELVR